jgi:hypothetical protein
MPAITGTLRDISRSGVVGLTLPVALPPRLPFVFRSTTLGAESVRADCRVANSRPLGNGRYVVGARIVPARAAVAAACPPVASAAPQSPAVSSPDPQANLDEGHVEALRQRLQRLSSTAEHPCILWRRGSG